MTHGQYRWSPVDWIMEQTWLPIARAFDLIDPNGHVDHAKGSGFLAFWVFVGLAILGKLPPLGHTITMFAAIFGSRMFMAFLKSKTVTASEARTVIDQTTRKILERRDHGLDAEATP